MKATLERLVNSGVMVLICPWCGWWAQCAEGYLICPWCGWWAQCAEGYHLDIDAFDCPDCKQPIDAVEPRK